MSEQTDRHIDMLITSDWFPGLA